MPYANEEVGFYVETKSMWRKWCPWPRLDRTCHEFYVDADVFIVSTPTELWRFCLEPSGRNFVVLREAPGSPAYFGNFGSRVAPILPPINAGLFGQRAGVDLTPDLLVELEWWKAHYSAGGAHVQDDQGAIAAALSHHYLQEQVEFLPQERYRIISPTSNRALTSLDGVAAFHATHPHHPAFHRFRSEVTQYIAGGELQ